MKAGSTKRFVQKRFTVAVVLDIMAQARLDAVVSMKYKAS